MKKRLFTLALALMLCLSLMPMAAMAAEEESSAPVEETAEETIEETAEETVEETEVEAVSESLDEPTAVALDGDGDEVTVLTSSDIKNEGDDAGCLVLEPGKSYRLGEDISATVVIRGEGDEAAVLDLNGCVLSAPNGKNSVIEVAKGKSLTVKDSNSDVTRKFTGNVCWGRDEENGTETVTGGVIYGGGSKRGVRVASGASFTLESGNIIGCCANDENGGGGVLVCDGTDESCGSFTMTGGSIRGCCVANKEGGGVHVGKYGKFTMTGGSITDCTASERYGGGVFAGANASFTMSDGEISDCHATYGGCALSGNANTQFILTGGTIGACTKSGCSSSGVDVSDLGTTMYAHGGTVNASVLVNKGGSTSGTIKSDPTVPGYEEGKTTAFYGKVTNKGTISYGIYYGGLENSGTITGKQITFMKVGEKYAVEVLGDGQESIKPTDPTPTAEYLTFTGWYTDVDNFENEYTFGSALNSNTTLFAGFDIISASATVTANTLTYNGAAQELVTAGTVEHGTIMYRLGDTGEYTATVPTAKDAGEYTVYYYAKGTDGYEDSVASSVSVTIAPKAVDAIVTVAEGPYTYTGSEIKPDVTVKDGETTIPAGEYTVSYSDNINAGTAKVSVTNKDGGNYIVSGSATFAIGKAASSATVTGKTLSYTGEAQELVTESGVKGGDVYYSVNGNATYENKIPTAKDVGTYAVAWYVVGDSNHESTKPVTETVTIAVPAGVGDAVKDMTVDTVTGDDRETIEATQKTVKAYLDMSPTEAEKTTLNALEDTLEKMIERLDEVKAALESTTITDADDITKNDVKTGDKKTLENAKAAIEKLMEDYQNNLTATEQRTLVTKLERISDALDEIAAIEKKNAGKDKANGVAQTGDTATPILWIVIVVAAVAAVVILLVVRKKKSK